MILDDHFWSMPTETPLDQMTRLRAALSLPRSYYGNAVLGLDYLRSLDARLAPAEVLRVWVLAISEELDQVLAFGSNLRFEHTALDRSIRELMNRLSTTDDRCVQAVWREDAEECLAAFLGLNGALLSPISILDYLLSEAKPRHHCAMTATSPMQVGRAAEQKPSRAWR